MKNRLVLIGLILLLAIPFMSVLRDFSREVIAVPFLYILWLGTLFFQGLPQRLLWASFFIIAIIISLRSLLKWYAPKLKKPEIERHHEGRVSLWADRIRMVTHSGYYKWFLAQYLGKLFLSLLAYKQGLSPEQVKRRLQNEELDIPPEISSYLKAGMERMIPRPISLLSRFIRSSQSRTQTSPLDLNPEIIVKFLRISWGLVMSTEIAEVSALANRVIEEVERVVVGKKMLLQKIIAAALVSGGHVLLEDYPGLAKTLIAKSFSTALGLQFKRIQFTPDLLPGDITGGYFYNRVENRFELREGPIFANIILADEINRASPKTQSALLEAMQEYQVTLEGETMSLPEPFIVIATQNPIEYEGTFPLPEAQLDRFIMKLSVGYPSLEEEQEILKRRHQRRSDDVKLQRVTDAGELKMMREVIEGIYIDPDIEGYIVSLIAETRKHRQVTVGASPRGSIALLKLSRAWAALNGRDYVLPDDVKLFADPVLNHRLILESDLWMRRNAASEVITAIIQTTPVPVIEGI